MGWTSPSRNLLRSDDTDARKTAPRPSLLKWFHWHSPLPLYPEPGGWLLQAETDNGDALYFIKKGLTNQWPTLIQAAQAQEIEVHLLPPALIVDHIAVSSLRSAILSRS
jgi:hypothetical protein